MPSLPVPLTRFVGRDAELAEAAGLLAGTRLLTLTGPGGAGKTRLALELASGAAGDFPDGVWFADLSPISTGEFVWDRVALTLGVKEPGQGRTWAEAIGHHLASRKALLVIDNCEHVVETASEVVASVLVSAPSTKVVATSREPLGVAGEVTWALPPLVEREAVELFTVRAQQARPQFTLSDDERAAVVDICRRLDGLPLAIELAAARVRALAPARIAAGLKDRFPLLSTGPRGGPRRQATLEASFDWSYDLLSEPERSLLRQLSVFAGGFDVEAAVAVCPAATLELLAALADRSLVIVVRTGNEEPRYRLLETVRQFAAEHLDEAGEVELIRGRHRDYYTQVAERAEPGLTSPDDARWQALLLTEQENLRAALAWSRDRGEAEALARLVVPLGMLWMLNGHPIEMQRWLPPAAERVGEVPPRLGARLRYYEALYAALISGRLGEVPSLAHESLALARAAGSKRDEAMALVVLGNVAGLVGGAEAMRPYLAEAIPLARSAGFPYGVVAALQFPVLLRLFQSRPDENWRMLQEAIAVSKSIQRHTQLTVRSFGGMIALSRGQLAEAHQILAAVVAEGRDMTDFNYLHCLIGVGLVEMFQGDFPAARRLVDEGLAAAETYEAQGRLAAAVGLHSRFVLGWIQLASGDALQARDSMAFAAEGMRASIARPIIALPLLLLSQAQLALGVLDEAAAVLDEATSAAQSRDLTWLLGRAGLVRARLRARRGDLHESESLVHDALNLSREADDQMGMVDGLELLATLAGEQDSRREAVRLWAAAEFRRSELGYARFPADRGPHDAELAAARAALARDDFAAAWEGGARLSVEDAIAYAARGRGERKRPSTGWASLTPSELEVVRLIGEHLSNPEIAARLFVSRATVKTHLVHIFSKLGIQSRSELAAQAMKRQLT